MNKLFRNSFAFASEPGHGMRLHYKLFELFVFGCLIWFCFHWAAGMGTVSAVQSAGGLANYLPVEWMYGTFFPYINASLITLLLGLGFFRVMPKLTLTSSLLLVHFQYVARYTMGKLPHESVFLGMALLAIVLAVWMIPSPRDRIRFVFIFLLFFMGLGYVMSGFVKIIGTLLVNPDGFWSDGRHLWLWIASRQVSVLTAEGSFNPGLLQVIAQKSWFLATAMLTYGLIAELLGFLLWFDRTRWISAVLLIGLHTGIGMVMGLFFPFFIAQLVFVGFRWDIVLNSLPGLRIRDGML